MNEFWMWSKQVKDTNSQKKCDVILSTITVLTHTSCVLKEFSNLKLKPSAMNLSRDIVANQPPWIQTIPSMAVHVWRTIEWCSSKRNLCNSPVNTVSFLDLIDQHHKNISTTPFCSRKRMQILSFSIPLTSVHSFFFPGIMSFLKVTITLAVSLIKINQLKTAVITRTEHPKGEFPLMDVQITSMNLMDEVNVSVWKWTQ